MRGHIDIMGGPNFYRLYDHGLLLRAWNSIDL